MCKIKVLRWDGNERYVSYSEMDECDEVIDDYAFYEYHVIPYFTPIEKMPIVGTLVPREMKTVGGDREDIRSSPEYIEWRKSVFERDNYTCQQCGSQRDLQAHHEKQVVFYPELKYDVDNGKTLCKECHREVPVERR